MRRRSQLWSTRVPPAGRLSTAAGSSRRWAGELSIARSVAGAYARVAQQGAAQPPDFICSPPPRFVPSSSTAVRTTPGQRSPARSDASRCCTSRQQNAHIIETREVLYRWHPWHGRTVCVSAVVVKGTDAFLRCTLSDGIDQRTLEIPGWMFDAVVCCCIEFARSAVVEITALRDVHELVSSTRRASAPGVVQAEHLHCTSGGADATPQCCSHMPADELVSSTHSNAAVGRLPRGGATANAQAVDRAAARAPSSSPTRGKAR